VKPAGRNGEREKPTAEATISSRKAIFTELRSAKKKENEIPRVSGYKGNSFQCIYWLQRARLLSEQIVRGRSGKPFLA
jgi:hypothetical protein